MLRDAGFEVVYLGLRQTPATIAAAAIEEDADAIGLSVHTGGHLTLVPAVIAALREVGLATPVVVGGIVPARDIAALEAEGVAAVLAPGASEVEVVDALAVAIGNAQ